MNNFSGSVDNPPLIHNLSTGYPQGYPQTGRKLIGFFAITWIKLYQNYFFWQAILTTLQPVCHEKDLLIFCMLRCTFFAGFSGFCFLQLFFYRLYICLVVIVNARCFLWITPEKCFQSTACKLYKYGISLWNVEDSLGITFRTGRLSRLVHNPCTGFPQGCPQPRRVQKPVFSCSRRPSSAASRLTSLARWRAWPA